MALNNILIVDDIAANVALLRNMLEPEGYRISAVRSGEKALAILEKLRPDIILLDVMMPEMDGFEVCRRIKADARLRQIPVIFVTANTQGFIEGFQVGGADYITKPIQRDEVLARVHTQLTLHEQRLAIEKKNEILRNFTSLVSHDLKEPLRGIRTYCEMSVQLLEQKNYDRIAELNQKKIALCDKMRKVIVDILDSARFEAFEPTIELLSLATIVDDVLSGLELMLEENSVDVTTQNLDQHLRSDKALLCEVLRNLIVNGVRYNDKEVKTLAIALVENDKHYVLSVTDNGMGIEATKIETIFLPMQKAHNRKQVGDSTGLGLYLSIDIVKRLQGDITVTSEVGKGSTFAIHLPKNLT